MHLASLLNTLFYTPKFFIHTEMWKSEEQLLITSFETSVFILGVVGFFREIQRMFKPQTQYIIFCNILDIILYGKNTENQSKLKGLCFR